MTLLNNTIDKDEIISLLAERHPAIFIQLLHNEDLPYLIQQKYRPEGSDTPNKVAAIKEYRTLTGLGLKEAIDDVGKMIEEGTIR